MFLSILFEFLKILQRLSLQHKEWCPITVWSLFWRNGFPVAILASPYVGTVTVIVFLPKGNQPEKIKLQNLSGYGYCPTNLLDTMGTQLQISHWIENNDSHFGAGFPEIWSNEI